MEENCPECGQKVDTENGKPGEQVECPACYCCFLPSANTETSENQVGDPVKQAPHPFAHVQKEQIRQDPLLSHEELEKLDRARSHRRPTKPSQYVYIIFGLCLASGVWAFVQLEVKLRTTFLSGMTLTQQHIFTGFFGLVSAWLIWIGSKGQLRWCRLLAVFILFWVFLAPQPQDVLIGDGREKPLLQVSPEPDLEQKEVLPSSLDDYTEADLEPLFSDMATIGHRGVLGVWVRDLNPRDENALVNYLKRMTQTRQMPKLFSRGRNSLIVINHSPLNFAEFKDLLEPLGTINFADDPSRLVDLRISPDLFEDVPPAAMLNDPLNEYFPQANLKELRSLDMTRIEAAAQRLSRSAPTGLRGEISRQLCELIDEPWGFDSLYVTALGTALATWAEPGDVSAMDHVAYVINALNDADPPKDLPSVMMEYLVREHYSKTLLVLIPRWMKQPYNWENMVIKFGPGAEQSMLNSLKSGALSQEAVYSCIRILEEIGTAASLPALEEYVSGDNEKAKNLSLSAIRKIEARSDTSPSEKAEAAEGEA